MMSGSTASADTAAPLIVVDLQLRRSNEGARQETARRGIDQSKIGRGMRLYGRADTVVSLDGANARQH